MLLPSKDDHVYAPVVKYSQHQNYPLFKLLYLLIRNYTRRSMFLNLANFKPFIRSSSPLRPSHQENNSHSSSIPFSGQSSNSNQYVGDDASDCSAQDSTLTKCTKCSIQSQSDTMEDLEMNGQVFEMSEKSSLKQLKKEMKKQKIKRKQSQKINLKIKKSKFDLFSSIQSFINESFSFEETPTGKQNENSKKNSLIEQIEIQNSKSNCLANLSKNKKIHTQNHSQTPKNHFSLISSFQLRELKNLNVKQESFSLSEKQILFQSQQTRIIQQSQILQQLYQNIKLFDKNSNLITKFNNNNYFIDDLVKQLKNKKQSKTHKVSLKKLKFVQNLINHSEKYQLAIETARPKDENVQKVNLPRRNCDLGKKTLLIDLDDTLIYTSNPLSIEEVSHSDLTIIQNDGRLRKLYLRPFAIEFLEQMSQHYEIIIFTAATKCYAEQIRKVLDPENKMIAHLLDRQYCFNPNSSGKNNGGLPYIKDLRKLNRDLKETVLLDNSIYSFWYQINNGIPIVSYNNQKENDEELLKVQSYLMRLIEVEDVRVFNQEYFRLEQYEQHVDAKTLVKELYIERIQSK